MEALWVPIWIDRMFYFAPQGGTKGIHESCAIGSYGNYIIIYKHVSVQTDNSVHHRKKEFKVFMNARVWAPLPCELWLEYIWIIRQTEKDCQSDHVPKVLQHFHMVSTTCK